MLYSLKTTDNQRLSDIFKGYKLGVGQKWFNLYVQKKFLIRFATFEVLCSNKRNASDGNTSGGSKNLPPVYQP